MKKTVVFITVLTMIFTQACFVSGMPSFALSEEEAEPVQQAQAVEGEEAPPPAEEDARNE
jgi:hypothetical protein